MSAGSAVAGCTWIRGWPASAEALSGTGTGEPAIPEVTALSGATGGARVPGIPGGTGRDGIAAVTAEAGFRGENTIIEAPIAITRNTPTEIVTNSNFFFSIIYITIPKIPAREESLTGR
jgi:hypothetical protein